MLFRSLNSFLRSHSTPRISMNSDLIRKFTTMVNDFDDSDAPVIRPTRIADFRSDTVTKPTPEMYIAMLDAEVGDDVYGEDKTVNQLEREAASKLGKEAALFVPTCTMANLLAVGSMCNRGDGVIVGDRSHIFKYEQGGASWVMGAVFTSLPNKDDGTLDLNSVSALIENQSTDCHFVQKKMLCIENTHNLCNGTPLTIDFIDNIAKLCKDNGIRIHMDGARLFNAAHAVGLPASRVVEKVDTVSICLSKGLGAPAGALLVGPADVIKRARYLRKAVGGGMRQVGILAGPGLVALKEMVPKLGRDNTLALNLARGLAAVRGIVLDPRKVKSNIVYFDVDEKILDPVVLLEKIDGGSFETAPEGLDSEKWISWINKIKNGENSIFAAAKENSNKKLPSASDLVTNALEEVANVKAGRYSDTRIRMVTHHQVRDEDVNRTLDTLHALSTLCSKE